MGGDSAEGWSDLDLWSRGKWKSLLLPGGALWLATVLVVAPGLIPFSAPTLNVFYGLVFVTGSSLALRFRSSRVLFALVSLLLAHRALDFFANGRTPSTGPGLAALEAIAFLLPLNFALLSLIREQGLGVPSIGPKLVVLFVESVVVAILCRPGTETSSAAAIHAGPWAGIPRLALLAFAFAFLLILLRFVIFPDPVQSGLAWSLAAALLSLRLGGVGRSAEAYWACAGLILVAAIVENSYRLAYHDELTTLPGRRAYGEALFGLEEPYAIAMADIDHFKAVNDTYGHDTGDEVLRMVAGKLARIGGGGRAYRIGGEEFAILFSGKSVSDVTEDLERLRADVEASSFRVRAGQERRRAPRGPDRRVVPRNNRIPKDKPVAVDAEKWLSVTISIGVAGVTPSVKEAEQVMHAADQALYKAKRSGRNRIMTSNQARARVAKTRRGIA